MLAVGLIARIRGVLGVPGGRRAPAGAVISVVAVTGLCVLALTHRPPA
jgi:hypothetical protein